MEFFMPSDVLEALVIGENSVGTQHVDKTIYWYIYTFGSLLAAVLFLFANLFRNINAFSTIDDSWIFCYSALASLY